MLRQTNIQATFLTLQHSDTKMNNNNNLSVVVVGMMGERHMLGKEELNYCLLFHYYVPIFKWGDYLCKHMKQTEFKQWEFMEEWIYRLGTDIHPFSVYFWLTVGWVVNWCEFNVKSTKHYTMSLDLGSKLVEKKTKFPYIEDLTQNPICFPCWFNFITNMFCCWNDVETKLIQSIYA